MKTILSLAIVTLAAALITSPLTAAEKLTIQVMGRPVSAYRTTDLEQVKKEAKETKKPIAWIASSPKVLENNGDIKGKSGRARPAMLSLLSADAPCSYLWMHSKRITKS